MRKVLSLLLAVILTFSLVSVASAADPLPYAGKTVILHSNDVHGAVADYDIMAQAKADYEAQGATVILADAGDYSQGSCYVSVSKGADAIALMNAVGYDVATLGNHEFDYGYEQLKANMADRNFKVICADIKDGSSPLFDGGHVIIAGASDKKIGFFGLATPETQTKANPSKISTLTFANTKEKLIQCAKDEVSALKSAGADVIICLGHLGIDEESEPYRSTDVLPQVPGIDLIIDGHSHSVMTATASSPIQSTGTKFANIGVVVIGTDGKIDFTETKLLNIKDSDSNIVWAGGRYATITDLATSTVIDPIDEQYGEQIGTTDVRLSGEKPEVRTQETSSGDLIADAMLWYAKEEAPEIVQGTDSKMIVAITNGGGIRKTLNNDAVAGTPISKKDILEVLPFGNSLAVVYVTGEELLESLEASTYCSPAVVGAFPQVAGINFTIKSYETYDANDATYPNSDYFGPKTIKRVVINSINGQPFDKNATYAVVTNDFCADGGDAYYAFAHATNYAYTGALLDETVVAYIQKVLNGKVGSQYAAPQGRITYADSALNITLSNNGVNTPVSIAAFGELPVYTCIGYTFNGWYLKGTKITAENFNTLVSDGDVLTAFWTVNYNGNTHSGGTASGNAATVSSAKTADAGVVLYVGMGIFSLMGMGYMGKKKEK